MTISTIPGGVGPQSEANPARGRGSVQHETGRGDEALGDSLRFAVRQRPVSALGIAAAAGFILGGGLASRQGLHALGALARAVLVPYVTKKMLQAMESEALDDAHEQIAVDAS